MGTLAEQLAEESQVVSDDVVAAAWVHDVGYATELVDTGLHALDGARALERLGVPVAVVALVGHHTGAQYEAEERGLVEAWSELPVPDPDVLALLTMIDLGVGPDGRLMRDEERIAEILGRYEAGHPVRRAVSKSAPELLSQSAKAKELVGLADDWPAGVGEGVLQSEPH